MNISVPSHLYIPYKDFVEWKQSLGIKFEPDPNFMRSGIFLRGANLESTEDVIAFRLRFGF